MWTHLTQRLSDILFFHDKGKPRLKNLAVFLLLVLPALFIGALSYRQAYRDLTANTYARRQALAFLAATTLKGRLDHMKDVGLSLATRVRFRQLIAERKWSEAVEILRTVPKDFPFIDRLFITDPAGTLMADIPELPGVRGRSFAFRDWYQGVSRSWEPYVSDVYQRAAEPRHNVIAIAVPIKAENQTIIGILVLQLTLPRLLDWTKEIQVGASGFVYIVDRKGHIAAHPKYAAEGEIVDFSAVPSVRNALSGKRGVEEVWNPVEKEQHIAAYEPVPGYGWAVVVQQPTATAYAARYADLRRIAIAYGLIFLFAAVLGYLVLRAVSERKRAEERFRLVIESAPNAILLVNPEGVITLINAQAEKLFGYDRSELLGQPVELLVPERVRANHPGHRSDFFRSPQARAMGAGRDLFARRKDGTEMPVEIGLNPVETPEGTVVLASIIDITERKRVEMEIRKLNEDLNRRAAELEAANKDLEAFSYSVSHDLRAPLRAMDGFSRILLEKHAAQMSPDAQRYQNLIRDNAQQMGRLIDDLLSFSRLGRQALKKQPVAPAEIVQQALRELSQAPTNGQAQISVKELPACHADPALVKQIFVNLLSNAIKFTRQRDPAQIEIGCLTNDGEPVYFVKDNGVGFDMKYSDKLFGVFQRLHRADEYEGTGVGLAIVQRIVHRHGGKVWAEAETNKGATFYFTLGGDST